MEAKTEAITLFLVVSVAAIAIPSASASGSDMHFRGGKSEFIRKSCSSTLYPALCYASLGGYAGFVGQDPVRLARVSANVSLSRVRSVSSHVSFLRRGSAAQRRVDARTASALKDCEETLGDAVDLTLRAYAEIGRLPAAKGTDVAWCVSNAQTWLSAALTNEGTCMTGFDEAAPASTVKADVFGRVRAATRYTSNSLALLNRLVA